MNRTQLSVLITAGTAAGVAWGAVLLTDIGKSSSDGAAVPQIHSNTAPPVELNPDDPQTGVPEELRVRTIEPGKGGTPRGGVVDDVATSPTRVGAAFVRTMWTYDTAIDTTSHDAAARAARWATQPLGSALARPATRTTPQWDEWTRHDAYTGVSIVEAPLPGQDVEVTERLRTYRVDVRVVGDRGYNDRLEPFRTTVTLVREDGLWLVGRIALT